MNNTTSPLISVLIPCRNEEPFISKCLDFLIANDYPRDRIEFFIIDGLSNDGTLLIAEEYIKKDQRIRIITNNKKIFPAAINIGIKESKGDLIFIIGAHATYENDYFSKCVENSLKYNADNVGGVIITVSTDVNLIGSMISFVLSNGFGVGNSEFRIGASEIKETDTVFGGCYKREVFQRFGLFNENLISTSDFEFNKRIKRGGAKILMIPDIKVKYYTRSTLNSFIKNNLRNGFWAIYPVAFTDHFPVSARHLIPLAFFISITFLASFSFLLWEFKLLLIIISAVYYLTAIIFTISAGCKSIIKTISMPFLFLSLHLSYGIGSFWGLIKVFQKRFFRY